MFVKKNLCLKDITGKHEDRNWFVSRTEVLLESDMVHLIFHSFLHRSDKVSINYRSFPIGCVGVFGEVEL